MKIAMRRTRAPLPAAVLGTIGALVACAVPSTAFPAENAGSPAGQAEGLTRLQAVVRARPRDFLAHFDLGDAQEARGDLGAAIAAYQQAVALRADFAEARRRLGALLLRHRKDAKGALAQLRQALLERPPYGEPRFPIVRTRQRARLDVARCYAHEGRHGLAWAISADLALALEEEEQDPALEGEARDLAARSKAILSPDLGRPLADELESMEGLLRSGKRAEALAGTSRVSVASSRYRNTCSLRISFSTTSHPASSRLASIAGVGSGSDGKPVWIMDNKSSYMFLRTDRVPSTLGRVKAVIELLRMTGTDVSRIVLGEEQIRQ